MSFCHGFLFPQHSLFYLLLYMSRETRYTNTSEMLREQETNFYWYSNWNRKGIQNFETCQLTELRILKVSSGLHKHARREIFAMHCGGFRMQK